MLKYTETVEFPVPVCGTSSKQGFLSNKHDNEGLSRACMELDKKFPFTKIYGQASMSYNDISINETTLVWQYTNIRIIGSLMILQFQD